MRKFRQRLRMLHSVHTALSLLFPVWGSQNRGVMGCVVAGVEMWMMCRVRAVAPTPLNPKP